MKRIVVKKNKNYTVLNNEFIFNKNLSLKSKGLLCHLLALPPDWVLYAEELTKWSTDGKTAIYSAITELMDNGYLKREQKRIKGKIQSWDYIVYEKPHLGNPDLAKPDIEKLDVENLPLISNNNTKDLLKQNIKEYPDELNLEAWEYWIAFRKEQFRSKYKPIGEKAAINKLLRIAPTKQMQNEVISQSIANGWKGLFPIKEQQSKLRQSLNEYNKGKEFLNKQFDEK